MANSMVDECRKKIAAELSKPKEDRDRTLMGECGNRLFEFEKGLFSYRDLLENSPAKQITISKDGVSVDIESHGHSVKMYLDPFDSAAVPTQILAKGEYEKEELDIVLKILRLLPPDAVIFDVGANLGWYGLNIQNVYDRSRVYYFEPVPETAERLKKNVELNGHDAARVFSFGLYDQNMRAKFYYDTVASGASSLSDLRELPSTRIIDVELRTMDDFVKNEPIERVDFIKCDVEGAELFVYKGGLNTIRKYKPVVFSEMLRKWSAKQGYHPNDIIMMFNELGYACYVIEKGCIKPFGTVTEDTIETNYFFLHKEKHEELCAKLMLHN